MSSRPGDDDAAVPRSGRRASRKRGRASVDLTARQIEILTHAARGMSNREIGRALGISEKTARNHMYTILRKLATGDRTRAVVLAIERGWIAIPIEPLPSPVPSIERTAQRKP
jgi:DNA-binding NarL/FixJ family response regulator